MNCFSAVFSIIAMAAMAVGAYAEMSAMSSTRAGAGKFVSWTSADGLPSDKVLDIREDDDGFMWIATDKGICRFDGSGFSSETFPETVLPTTCVCPCGDYVYVGSGNGLWRLDRFSGIFESVPIGDGQGGRVRSMLYDGNGILWLHLSDGTVRRHDIATGETLDAGFKGAYFEGDYYYDHIFMDSGGTVWVGGRATSVARIDNGDIGSLTYPVRNPGIEHFEGSAFASDADGVFHATDDKGNFSVYDRDKGIFRTVLRIPSGSTCATTDRSGNIWIGGRNGLIRLFRDKSGYEIFPSVGGDPATVASNNVYCLYSDGAGNVWVGTDKGLSFLSARAAAVTSLGKGKGLSSDAVTCLMQDRDSLLWAGTEENGVDTLNLRTLSSGNLRYDLLSGKLSPSVRKREASNLRKYAGHGLRRDGGLNENRVSALYQDGEGTVYIGLWSHVGFNTYDKETGIFKRHCLWGVPAGYVFPLLFEGNPFGANWYTDFLEDSKGNLWCATWEGVGLNLFDRDKGEFTGRHFIPGDVPRMPRGTICSHVDDREHGRIYMAGGKWYGYFDLRTRDFHRYVETFPDGFPEAETLDRYYAHSPATRIDIPVNTLDLRVLDKSGDWMLVSSANSLFAHDVSTDKVEVLFRPRAFRLEYDVFKSGGDYFVAWDDECVRVAKGGTAGFKVRLSDMPDSKDSLPEGGTFPLGGDSLFVQTDSGSVIRVGPEGKMSYVSRDAPRTLPSRLASRLAEDGEGFLWYGTTDSGICRLDPATGETRTFRHEPGGGLPGNDIRDIFLDSSGTMWVGTENGLCVYGDSGAFRGIEAVGNISVRRVIEDRKGRIWVSSDTGLHVLSGGAVYSFHVSDGLSNEAYSSAAAALYDGRLAFGGGRGLDIIDPDALLGISPPTILAAELRTEDGMMFHCVPERIRLRHRENSFSVAFSAIGLRGHPKRYRLDGFEREWNLGDEDKVTARYTNLPGGKYGLRVEILGYDGSWTGKEIVVDVDYPIWLRWWFLLMSAAVLACAVILLSRIRERRLREENRRLSALVDERTAEIKRQIDGKDRFISILSHDLRNSVTSISLLTGSLVRNWDKIPEEERAGKVGLMDTAIGDTTRLLNDILAWGMSESGISMPDMTVVSVREAVEAATGDLKTVIGLKGISVVNEVDASLDVLADKDMLSVILRNLLSNAVKYSYKGGVVTVRSERDGDKARVTVEDNGTGMDPETVDRLFKIGSKISVKGTEGESGNGFGLFSVSEFLRKMGGDVRVESLPGKGSKFSFTLCLAHKERVRGGFSG